MGLFNLFDDGSVEEVNTEASKKPDQVVQTSKKAGPAKMAKSGAAGPGGGKPPEDSVTPTQTKRGKATYGSSPNKDNRNKTGDIVNAKGVKGKVKK